MNSETTHSAEKQQIVNELHKPSRKNFNRRRTIIKGLDDLWQIDLAQLDQYSSFNRKFKYIMVVIDCFSKMVWAHALKSKNAVEVANGFKSILKSSSPRKPNNLQSDQGKEFFNKHFAELMKNHKINHYNTYSNKKASIVERVIRTLKENLFKYFSLNGSYKWIDILPQTIENYNNTKHRTTGMKPVDINKQNEQDVLPTYSFLKIANIPKFSLGDVVRISKEKYVFKKGYTPNWTTELFKIVKIRTTNPTTYHLTDMSGRPILGCFYEHELQKTNQSNIYLVEKVLRKRGKKVYVKWLGFDSSHNSWIDTINLYK